MGSFGGGSQFGGSSQFGGGESYGDAYYRVCKAMALPGFWPSDDDAILNKRLRTICEVLEAGQVQTDTMFRELFPQTAGQDIVEWETLLGIISDDRKSLADRQLTASAKYGGARESIPDAIRAAVVDALNPEYAYRDDMADAALHWRYTVSQGGGSVTEGSGVAVISDGGTAVTWGTNAPYMVLDTADRDDAVTLFVNVSTYSVANGSPGVWLLSTTKPGGNGIGVRLTSGGRLQWQAIVDGTVYDGPDITAIPAAPFWTALTRGSDGSWSFGYGSQLTSLTTVQMASGGISVFPDTIPFPGGIPIRHVGVSVVRSTSGTSSVSIDLFRVQYGMPKNNVNLGERRLSHLNSGGERDLFLASITRSIADSGEYDLQEAQRIADSMSPAHCLILVGESDAMVCDDTISVCDRDVMSL